MSKATCDHEHADPYGKSDPVQCGAVLETIQTYGGEPFARVCGSGHVFPLTTQEKLPKRCGSC